MDATKSLPLQCRRHTPLCRPPGKTLQCRRHTPLCRPPGKKRKIQQLREDAVTLEQEARRKIDRQLGQCGWLVQDYRGMDLSAGPGVAVREFPLTTGLADYLLYVDRRVLGVIEAKPEGHTLTGVETQSAKYTRGLPANRHRRKPTWSEQTPGGCLTTRNSSSGARRISTSSGSRTRTLKTATTCPTPT